MANALTAWRNRTATSSGGAGAMRRLGTQLEALKRARASAAGRATGKGGTVMAAGCVAVGGAASGLVVAKLPTLGGFDSRAIIGGAMVLGGIWGLKGKPGSVVTLLGAGMVGAWAGDKVEAWATTASTTATTETT